MWAATGNIPRKTIRERELSRDLFFLFLLFHCSCNAEHSKREKWKPFSWKKGGVISLFPIVARRLRREEKTIGSFLFPGWIFTFDTDKWEPDRKAKVLASSKAAPSLGAAALQSGCSCRNLHPLSLPGLLSLDVVVLLLLGKKLHVWEICKCVVMF